MKKPASTSARVSPEALQRLFDQLSLATRSELSIADALQIVAQDIEADEAARTLLSSLAVHVRGGGSLSDALRRSGADLAPETLALLVKAEQEGALPVVLHLLARDYEHRARFRTATRAAAAWPLVSLGFFVLVLIAMAVFVIPKFEEVFEGFDANLPGPTRLLIAISHFLVGAWFVWIPIAALAIFAWVRYRRRWEWLQARMDALAFRTPIVRTYLAKTLVSRLASSLIAVADGAPLVEVLGHLRATLASRAHAATIAALEARVAAGTSLAEAMAASPGLPGRLRVAVELGSRAGLLGAALRQTQALSDEEAERSLMRLEQGTLVAAYVAVGVLVAFIVLAMYLPIFKMGSVI
ncbi:MAG: type II secretion system F family protein [Usitatibacter sp.]